MCTLQIYLIVFLSFVCLWISIFEFCATAISPLSTTARRISSLKIPPILYSQRYTYLYSRCTPHNARTTAAREQLVHFHQRQTKYIYVHLIYAMAFISTTHSLYTAHSLRTNINNMRYMRVCWSLCIYYNEIYNPVHSVSYFCGE